MELKNGYQQLFSIFVNIMQWIKVRLRCNFTSEKSNHIIIYA